MSQKRYKNLNTYGDNFNYQNNYFNNIRSQYQLSEAERDSVKKSGNKLLIESVNSGDEALKRGDIITEASDHRFVKDELRKHM